jgi:hypothetical protein
VGTRVERDQRAIVMAAEQSAVAQDATTMALAT